MGTAFAKVAMLLLKEENDVYKKPKWLWRYGVENDVLWRMVIGAKYGNNWGGWCTKSVSGAYGICMWKSIRSGWLNFSKFLQYEVGDGTRVKFWDDVWCGDCPLKEAFLDLYNISRIRDASVSKVMCYANERIFWDLQFRRLVNDQESQSLDSCSPWVAFFSWTTALCKILTIDNLRKRHFVVLEWCYMCKRCGESVDHLLLHYPIAYEMWSMIGFSSILYSPIWKYLLPSNGQGFSNYFSLSMLKLFSIYRC
ncbi:hypothetical protein ACB092_03G220100 [Castanea dentata]